MNNFSLALIVLNTMIGMFSAHIPSLHSYFYLRKNVSVLFIPQTRPSFNFGAYCQTVCHAGFIDFQLCQQCQTESH